jgi:two-component system cell cycle sensor histidine kinase/response regulator CckA
LQAQLLQAQKMEAIGTLAGGVAHDFNNILMAVIGYSNLLQMKMDTDDPLKLYVDQILASSQKATNLTRSLLAFSRKQAIELKPLKMPTILKGIEKLLRRLLPEDIELRIISSAPDTIIMADIGQMDQVLLNLATNARDAMPKGGRLTVETKEVELDNRFKKVHRFGEPGRYALVSVTDTGIGMDERTKAKIFEPFFTTKEVGKGTGLGLAIVYGIIKQHDGYVTVTSEPGQGTTFQIYLRAVKVKVQEATDVPVPIRGGTETILLAEDNKDLRGLMREVLTGEGYAVIEAGDGEDGLYRFMEQKDGISLLILDVVMPKKDGKEVYEEICKVKPDIKTIFVSGHTGDVVIEKGVRDGAFDFISKPVSPSELLQKVRSVLDM